MIHNVGKIDRIIRLILGLVILILAFTNVIPEKQHSLSFGIGGILLITSFRRCCPIYALLGMGTCGVETSETDRKIETGTYNPNK